MILGAMGTMVGDVLNAHALIPPHLLFLTALTRSATRLISLPNFHLLFKPTRHCLTRTAKRHTSPLDILFRTTNIKPKSYETILPAHRRCDYELLATIHINDDRSDVITRAKATTGLAAYTDGSGNDGKIGTAATLMIDEMELGTLRYQLRTESKHTVYEAEVTVVLLALHLLMQVQCDLKKVTISVNNQAVLLGLKNQRSKPKHHLLDRVHDALEDFQFKSSKHGTEATQSKDIDWDEEERN